MIHINLHFENGDGTEWIIRLRSTPSLQQAKRFARSLSMDAQSRIHMIYEPTGLQLSF